MTYLIVLVIYLAVLFVVAWMSRSSLGVPTLALAAGALLADIWTDSLTPVVAQAGIVVTKPPLTSIIAIALTILPALVVMIRSHRVSSQRRSIIGSVVFAVLAAMLTYNAFSNAVVLDDTSRQYAAQIAQYRTIIITACIGLALLETITHRKSHHETPGKKKRA